MNDLTTFVVVTTTIFAAVTALLALMCHLEADLGDDDVGDGPPM